MVWASFYLMISHCSLQGLQVGRLLFVTLKQKLCLWDLIWKVTPFGLKSKPNSSCRKDAGDLVEVKEMKPSLQK